MTASRNGADMKVLSSFAVKLYPDGEAADKALARLFAETYQLGGVRVLSALVRGRFGRDEAFLRHFVNTLPLSGEKKHHSVIFEHCCSETSAIFGMSNNRMPLRQHQRSACHCKLD